MEDKWFVTLSLSKEVLDRTLREVVALLSRLLLRVEVFTSYSSGSKPADLFSNAFEPCRSMNSARFLLSLSLSLSLLNSIYLLLQKQSWQRHARTAFCFFMSKKNCGILFSRWERRTCEQLRFEARVDKGDRFVERILSLRQACRLQGKRVYSVLVDAMQSFLHDSEPDLAWIYGIKLTTL
jgi:hypothetical protein